MLDNVLIKKKKREKQLLKIVFIIKLIFNFDLPTDFKSISLRPILLVKNYFEDLKIAFSQF